MAFQIPNYQHAAFDVQSEPDRVDFEILTAGHAGYGVVEGCAVTASDPGVALTVDVAPGTARVGGNAFGTFSGPLTPAPAHTVNGRFDLITLSPYVTPTLTAGTPAAVPVLPPLPANHIALAAVYIPPGATNITAANIIDKRVMLPVLFSESEHEWFHPGVVAVNVGSEAWVARWGGVILGVSITATAGPTGQPLIADINKNGAGTIFDNQANRPQLAVGQSIGAETVPFQFGFGPGDWFTCDLDQVGSTFAGSDVRVILRVRRQ